MNRRDREDAEGLQEEIREVEYLLECSDPENEGEQEELHARLDDLQRRLEDINIW